MIQDIYPHKLDNHFDIDAKPDNDSIVLYFTKEGILQNSLLIKITKIISFSRPFRIL